MRRQFDGMFPFEDGLGRPSDRLARRRATTLFGAAPTAMALLRPDGRCLEVNPELSGLLGFSARHLRRRRLQDLTEPEQRNDVAAALARLGAGGRRTEVVEARLLRRDDRRPVWLEVSLAVVRGAAGESAWITAQFRLIGTSPRLAWRPADVDAPFRRAFEGSAIGVAILAVPGSTVLRANPALCAMLRRPPAEVIGSDLLPKVHPADGAVLRMLLTGLRGRPRPTTRELRFVVGPEEVLWALVSAGPVDLNARSGAQALLQVVDIASQKETEFALRHQTLHDALTGLPNRCLLLDRLGQALARSERSPGPAVVLYVDLDHFKSVNDALGHDAGDRLLVEVAGRLAAAVRPTDTVARIGGDEFVVLAEGLRLPRHRQWLADRIRGALAPPVTLAGQDIVVSASIGTAIAAEGEDPLALLRKADHAMYQAKRARAGSAGHTAAPGRGGDLSLVSPPEAGLGKHHRERLEPVHSASEADGALRAGTAESCRATSSHEA